jgi:ABC-type nitrate/sulfonate/bicarbonate transport system ATPase subunit
MTAHFAYEMKETLVRIDRVSLSFGDKVVLKPTSAEVKNITRPGMAQGQVVGILGPSGIGKSQFSRILAGLREPTSGAVLVSDLEADASGAKMTKVRPSLVGMVSQSYPLFRHRTVLGNLLVALEHSELAAEEREAKARRYLADFGLVGQENRYPCQLSGGQRQRVAIIRELLCSERFLVMDEPFTGLDPVMKDAVCEVVNQVARLHEQNTIFIVSHDIPAVVTISDCLWLFGRDSKEGDKSVSGATIKHRYNLIERGLAWQKGIDSTRAFADFCAEVKEQFENL